MYYKEFDAQQDWMHHGEGLQLFNRMGSMIGRLERFCPYPIAGAYVNLSRLLCFSHSSR